MTKAIHNGLQGAERVLTDSEKATYLATARDNAAAFGEEYDFVFMHDPQTVGILPMRGKGSARWVWRCHIDTSAPNASVWDFIRPMLVEYDAAIFTMRAFVPPSFPLSRVETIPPAIDPLSPKNMALPPEIARRVPRLDRHPRRSAAGDASSRFDPWKDPMGVIAAYRLARKEIAGLELALVGSMALDDPEGWKIHRAIEEETRRDPAITC